MELFQMYILSIVQFCLVTIYFIPGPCSIIGDYFYSNEARRCYVKVQEPMKFTKAFRGCQEIGGSLLEIHSSTNQDTIDRYLVDSNAVYIGLNDILIESNFVWIASGQDLRNFTHWGDGQPADVYQDHDEDCVQILLNGFWNDIDCNIVRPFLCEMNMTVSYITGGNI